MRLQQITARPHPAGNRIDLSWVNVDPTQYPGVRVVRREHTHPVTPDDGVVVAEGVGLEAAQDIGLKGETVYYYTLFPYRGSPPSYTYHRENRTVAMATAPYDMAERMYELLPAIYHRYDTQLPDLSVATAMAADRQKGQLRRFLDLPGSQLDRIYSLARAMLDLYDIDKVDGRLLPLLAQWIGWYTNHRLEIETQRNEIRSAPSIYKRIGIIPTVEATIKRILGWESRVKEFVHNVFTSNQPEQLNIWIRQRPANGAWTEPREPLSLDFAHEGRPAVAQDAAGTHWLFYHTRRNDRWDIWHKTLFTFSVDPLLAGALDDGYVTSALQETFAMHGFVLSQQATVDKVDGEWRIDDVESGEAYVVKLESGQLNVYRWSPSARLTNRLQVDKHPTAVGYGDTLEVYWSVYDQMTQTWHIDCRIWRNGAWSPIQTFGGEEAQRKSPAAAADHTGSVWLFWLEKEGDRWQLKYARRASATWDLATIHTFPLANGEDPRVATDLYVLFQDAAYTLDATPRLWVFWARKVPIDQPRQTRWQIAYRIATEIDPGALTWIHAWSPDYPDHRTVDFTTTPPSHTQYLTWQVNRPPVWGNVYTLPAVMQDYHSREPAAFVDPAGAVELFWSSNQDRSWSIWRTTLQDLAPPRWARPEAITGPPYSQRTPLPISILGHTWLLYRSNESVVYTSTVYGATQTTDFRYAGATTVDTRNVAKIALDGQYENFQTYTYVVGRNGRRTDLDWYARDTVGIFLSAETEDQQDIVRSRNLIQDILRQFLPIQVRIVFIIPIVSKEPVYTYEFPGAPTQYLIGEQVFDSTIPETYSGLGDAYQDIAPDWIWVRAWSETSTDHRTVDASALPVDTRFRTWHIGLQAGG